MGVDQDMNFRKSFKFVNEQVIFSISSFVFLRNLLKDLDFETAGHIGIYLVATFSLLSIIRPLGLKIFSLLINQKNQSGIVAFELNLLIRLKVPLSLAGLILSLIGLSINISSQIQFLLPTLGFLFILNDIFRIQNIVDGNPEKNWVGNIVVLLLSLGSFFSISQSTEFSILYLWIFSQILFFILLWKSRRNFRKTSRSYQVDFTKTGNVLSLESLITQTLGFIFIFWLTEIDPDFSGQFRVATSAFATIPILFFSALASPYSVQIAIGNVEVRKQVLRLSITLAAFISVYAIVTHLKIIGSLMAGRETKTFEGGIAPAFAVATLVTLNSHITHSYAEKLTRITFLVVRVFPVGIMYSLILIFVQNSPILGFETILWSYLFSTYLFIVVILRRYGTGHNVSE
jgi:hypothetical protein